MSRLPLLRAAVIQLLERKTTGNESYWSISRKCTCRRRKRGREAHLLPWRGPSPFPTVFPLPRKDGDEAFRRQERAFGETQKGLLLLPGLAGCRFPFLLRGAGWFLILWLWNEAYLRVKVPFDGDGVGGGTKTSSLALPSLIRFMEKLLSSLRPYATLPHTVHCSGGGNFWSPLASSAFFSRSVATGVRDRRKVNGDKQTQRKTRTTTTPSSPFRLTGATDRRRATNGGGEGISLFPCALSAAAWIEARDRTRPPSLFLPRRFPFGASLPCRKNQVYH